MVAAKSLKNFISSLFSPSLGRSSMTDRAPTSSPDLVRIGIAL